MVKHLPVIFEMDPLKVPISEFPITNLQPIYDFNEVCYNTASEFVDGFDQDMVKSSKGGQYCKDSIINLTLAVGKDPCHRKFRVPIISIRPKLFMCGIKIHKGNPEKALEYCIKESEKHGHEVGYCSSAYKMYKNVYDNKKENLKESLKEHHGKKVKNKECKGDECGSNCWIASIVSIILVVLFVIMVIYGISALKTMKI